MPGKVKVKIIAGRNLPVMDRSSDTTDAYVEIKLGSITYKTDVCRKSLHPQWNSEWYRFEVDDAELQDEPLQIRLMDHDTYSANDAIGKVYLDLNPLLLPVSLLSYNSDYPGNHEPKPNSVMSGWIPVYDTMHGIRGEVNITVKVELFTDSNKFRQSSCGVQFFCSPAIPQGYFAQIIHGFVEELLVNDDPEYQWIDKIRTPRASNEARQTLFFKLSGELQRKIGVKALDIGGNAVIGYNQSFDLEGDSGIVARGIGTAVTLVKILDIPGPNTGDKHHNEERVINYLKFLSADKGFHLNKTNYNKYLPNLSKKLHTISSISANKSNSHVDKSPRKFKRYNSNTEVSPLPAPIIQHAASLQTLLKQEDMRGTPGTGIAQRIKNLKYNSQNIFSKKMSALKCKLSDTTIPASTDAKKKRNKFRRTVSETSPMAELLVRSVIQVHSSLDCIMENQNNDTPPVLQKQKSLTESSNHKQQRRRKTRSYLSLPGGSVDAQSLVASDISETSSSEEDESEMKDTMYDEFDTVSQVVKNVRRLSRIADNVPGKMMLSNELGDIDSVDECSINISYEERSEWQLDSLSVTSTDKKISSTSLDEDDNNNQITPIIENEENEFNSNESGNVEDITVTERNGNDNNLEQDESIYWKFEDIPSDYNSIKVLFDFSQIDDSDLPPKAEVDDFDLPSSENEQEPHNNVENLPETPKRKLIIPPVVIGTNFNEKRLVKSAVEMLLLDKANLLGTYTPPASPPANPKRKFKIPSRSKSFTPTRGQSFFPQISEAYEIIRRSSTQSHVDNLNAVTYNFPGKSISLGNIVSKESDELQKSLLSLQDYNRKTSQYENVLEVPSFPLYTKNTDIPKVSVPPKCASVASSPYENEYKHKFTSLNDVNIKTSKHHSFLVRAENKIKNVFQVPLNFIRKDSKKKNSGKSENKLQHGLLGTALENVLIDSVNEIMATSHINEIEDCSKDSEYNEVPSNFTNVQEIPLVIGLEKLSDSRQIEENSAFSRQFSQNIKPENDPNSTKLSGLVSTALQNVLIDSVNDIMATSRFKESDRKKSVYESNETFLGTFSEKFMNSPKDSIPKSPIEEKVQGPKLHGLVGTALQNVLMDSVNDIMATSRFKDDKKMPEYENKVISLELPAKFANSPNDSISKSPFEEKFALPGQLSENVTPKNNFNGTQKNVITDSTSQFKEDSRNTLEYNNNMPTIDERELGNGLLGVALQNALMDTFNDVLATSNVKENQNNIEKANENLIIKNDKITHTQNVNPIIQCEVINNNMSSPKLPTTTPDLPANIGIDKGNAINKMHASFNPFPRNLGSPQSNYNKQEHRHQRTESVGAKVLQSPAKLHAIPCIHRRSSDSDLSITPKAFLSNFSFMGGKGFFRKRNSLTGSDRSCGPGMHFMRNSNLLKTTLAQENFDIVEYPFLTMSKFPPGFVSYLGGAVSARSVKLLERISNLEEPETRDIWWSEIRMEIRSHARSLNCNAVLGYNETTSICDDVCVLSANGTAAVIGYQYNQISECLSVLPVIPKSYGVSGRDGMSSSLDRSDFDKDKQTDNTTASNRTLPQSPEKEINMHQPCMICHLPYSGTSIALRTASAKCRICRYGRVPDVLITTIEMPEGTPCIGRGCFLQSYVCRPLKDLKGESNAKEISDGLPFLEYEIHRILVNKLKVKGMNAIFGLKIRLSIGDKMIIGIATGTAVFLLALPTPPLPKLVSDRTTDEKKLAELQKELHETIKKNKEIYQTKLYDNDTSDRILSDTDESEDEQTMFDLSAGNKDCCILEIDDPEDVEVINLLMEPRPPDGFHIVNTEFVPGLEDLEIVKNLQMFIQIWRTKIQPPYSLDKIFNRLLQTIYFKLRRMIPCALCDMQFRVDTPEPDEIQLCVLGMALGLGDPPINLKTKRKPGFCKRNDEDLIFKMEEINLIPENSVAPTVNSLTTQLSIKHRQKSPQLKNTTPQTHTPYRERHGVDITPLSYVPGGKIERYLGNLNFFFIRETTSIREEGGLSGFIHSFVTEVLAIVRAHVTALGGNAMVAYFMTECVLNHNPHKNQGQCLINIGGDVVSVSYFSEEE